MKIEITAHDPAWAEMARAEAERWQRALGATLSRVHHVGSTAVEGLSARPVIDLIPVIAPGTDPDSLRPLVHGLGYEWLGEHGLPRRRYCRRSSATTGRRLFQAHCWSEGDSEITRHLAFRDALRADPLLRGAYEQRKRHCASLHLHDPAGYGACKAAWIDSVEARALASLGEDGA
ncbi:MAG: GrpB family protein [Tropicimonas sp.]|uniref:GrpB family protein n=1 Tax=Tropicimonas sp. TaxID=2067044 RepID=UPI003A888B50